MDMNQKFWCWITTFALILGLCTPLGGIVPTAAAEESPAAEESVPEDEPAAEETPAVEETPAATLLSANATGTLYAGTWGDNITWSIEDGVLSLSGEGPMDEAAGFSCDLSPEHTIYHTNDGVSFVPYPWSTDYYISQEIDAEPAEFSSVIIGEGITTLAAGAFYKFGLESITLPSTLTSIGDFALAENPALGKVSIPESVTEIGMYAFHATTADSPEDSLPLTIPGSVETIGAFAFSDNRYTSILLNKGLLSIGEGAFFNGTEEPATPTAIPAAIGIRVPASVQEIGPGAFCTAVMGIIVLEGNQYYTDVCGQLYDIDKTFLHTRPRYYRPDEWSSTSDYEESLHMRPEVIGEYAYSCSPTLTQAEIPSSVREIQDNAFAGCTALEEVTFEPGGQLQSIGDSAFFNCPRLSAIDVPVGVESIGMNAFDGCLLSRVSLPEGLETIGAYAFWGCQFSDLSLPDSVTDLGRGAFLDCDQLEAISLPSALDRIVPELFSGCTALESVTMGEAIASVGDQAFYECTALSGLSLPGSVKSVGDEAFYNCSSLQTLSFPSSLTSIGESAFENAGLMELSLPDTVTTLGVSAFSGCPMTQARLSAGLTKIPGWAFYNCRNLTGLTVPAGVTAIGEQAFSGCKALTAVSLPESVNTIGQSAFRDCAALAELAIPEGVTSIGKYAFSGCTQLRSLEMPKTMKTVDICAFEDCASLEKVSYNSTCAAWDEIDIAEEGNQDLRFALITCTDGYYGVGSVEHMPKFTTVDIFPDGGSANDRLPLYSTAQYYLIIDEEDWDDFFTEHENLFIPIDGSSYRATFTGTISAYSSGEMLFSVSDPTVNLQTHQFEFHIKVDSITRAALPNSTVTFYLTSDGEVLARSVPITAFPVQQWPFENYSSKVPSVLVSALLGKVKAFELETKLSKGLGTDGLCFGMALTASLIDFGDIPISSFGCRVLDQVQKTDTMLTIPSALENVSGNMNADELIKIGHVMQHYPLAQQQLEANHGKYADLVAAINRYKMGTGAMPLIYMEGTNGNIHTVCAYDYRFEVDLGIFYVTVYDNAFPNRVGEISFDNYNYPEHSTWKYIDMGTYFGSIDTLTFLDPSAVYEFESTEGFALFGGKTSSNSLGNLFHAALDHISSDAGTGEGQDAEDPSILCWLSGSGAVVLEDLVPDTEAFVADDYASYTIRQADTGTFRLTDGEVAQAQASGEAVDLSCEYFPNDGDTLVCVTFQGTCAEGESVSLTYDPETQAVDLTDAGQGTITVTYNDGNDATEDPTWTQNVSGGTVSVTGDGSAAPEINSDAGTSGGSSSGGSSSGSSSSSGAAIPESDPTYADVPADYWAYTEIAWAWENGYMSGTAATSFNPGGTVSRQQVWMILARMAGENPADMAAAKAWAVANGISDGSNPGGAVTRQQLAALLYRYAVRYGYDVSVGEDTNILSYTDFADLSEYAIPAMQWACGAGIINGTGDGSTLSPQGVSTRAQLAVMLYRWLA